MRPNGTPSEHHRVDIRSVDPHRKMERLCLPMNSGDADAASPPHGIPSPNTSLVEVGIRGADAPAMINRDGRVPHYDARVRDRPGADRSNNGTVVRRNVNTEVPGPAAENEERSHDLGIRRKGESWTAINGGKER